MRLASLRLLSISFPLAAFLMMQAGGAAAQQGADALASASLEDLTQISVDVSSFARKDQDLWKTPAAAFVITQEDIAHSAASSIPELLRMVPGMQVAQVDAGTWAISARGFNSVYADRLLVLIDGRTLYSEIYSGVHWDEVDLPLDLVERIEIIRGPGAAVWGANAVNGIVNIITKKPRSAIGTQVSSTVSRVNDQVALTYGAPLGDRLQFRASANFVDRRPLETADGALAFDGEDTLRGGGRIDWQRTWADTLSLSGDMYKGHLRQNVLREIAVPVGPNGEDTGSIAGGFLNGRWEHKTGETSSAVAVYFDDQSRYEINDDDRTRTADVDYEAHRAAGERNDLVWGGEYRFTADHISGPVLLTTAPEYRHFLVDGFLQDDLTLVRDRLILTLGSKLEEGSLAGFQVQPSARLLWAPDARQSIWGAVSRAVVAPALQERAIVVPLNVGTVDGLPETATITGSASFKPESVKAFEAGYRRRFRKGLSLDLAGFYNRNNRLTAIAVSQYTIVPTPEPHVTISLPYVNGFDAHSFGMEALLSWKVRPGLSFRISETCEAAHTFQRLPGSVYIVDSFSTPRNNVFGSASWEFRPKWSADAFINHLGAISTPPVLATGVSLQAGDYAPAYTRLDLHVSHAIGHGFDLTAGGTNLLTPRHIEFFDGTDLIYPNYIPRSLFLRARWSF